MPDFEQSSVDRGAVAKALYQQRGPVAAANRFEANSQFGTLDLKALVVERLSLRADDRVMDLGCGSGGYLKDLASAVGSEGAVLGIDFSERALEAVARLQPSVHAVAADACRLPVRTAWADRVCCNYALYYFPDLKRACDELKRVLRPGGRLLVTGPAIDNNMELYAFHRRATGLPPSDADVLASGYVSNTAVPVLEAAGFCDIQLETVLNAVNFPSTEAFLAYYASTSLCARSFPAGAPDLRGFLEEGVVCVTKKITVLTATRGGH
jgi:SAM-dependent methyltransferase